MAINPVTAVTNAAKKVKNAVVEQAKSTVPREEEVKPLGAAGQPAAIQPNPAVKAVVLGAQGAPGAGLKAAVAPFGPPAPPKPSPAPATAPPAKPASAPPAPPPSGIRYTADRAGLSPEYQSLIDASPYAGTVTSTARPGRDPGRTHGSANSNGVDFVPDNWAHAASFGMHYANRGKVVINEGNHLHVQNPIDANQKPGYYKMNADGSLSPVSMANAKVAPSPQALAIVPGQVGSAASGAPGLAPRITAPEKVPVPNVDLGAVTRAAASYTPGAAPGAAQAADTSFVPAPAPAPYVPAPAQDISQELTTLGNAPPLAQGGMEQIVPALGSLANKTGATIADMARGIPTFLQSGAKEVQDFAGRMVSPSRHLGGQSPLALLATGLTLMDPKASVADAMKAGQEANALTQAPAKHASEMATQEQSRRYQAALGFQASEQPRQQAAQMQQRGAEFIAGEQGKDRRDALSQNHQSQVAAMNAETQIAVAMINGTVSEMNAATRAGASGSGSSGKVDPNEYQNAARLAVKGMGFIDPKKDISHAVDVMRNAWGSVPQFGNIFDQMYTATAKRIQAANPDIKPTALDKAVIQSMIATFNVFAGATRQSTMPDFTQQ